MTQLIAILTIPLIAYGCFLTLGRGVLQGYLGLAMGTSLLLIVSIAKGAIEIGWSFLSADTTTCSAGSFYDLSGGIGCSPIPVAMSYAIILYGIANLTVIRVKPRDSSE